MKRNFTIALLNSSACLPLAFDTGQPGWKLDADGNIELREGNPVYINAQGQESAVRGETISSLNGEAKQHRVRAEQAEAELKKYEGIKDPVAALKAVETVSKLDAKQLIDAGEVDKVKESIKTEMSAQMEELKKENDGLKSNLNSMTRSTAFKGSKFIQERVAVPPEMFEKTFSDNFKIEDGKIVPYHSDGNKVFSKQNHGEIAPFDEALEILVGASPWKDQILKAPDHSGSGNGGGGGGRDGQARISRAEFDKLEPMKRAEVAAKSSKGEVVITD